MNRQSLEPPPEEQAKPEFDTTTPANTVVRRFTLNDLPRYADSLYPHLKARFPHLHQRMYGGWLHSCMDDNATHFICGNATVAMARIVRDALDPTPMVEVIFCLGAEAEFEAMYRQILRWASDLGAPEVRVVDAGEIARKLKHQPTETRRITVFHLKSR